MDQRGAAAGDRAAFWPALPNAVLLQSWRTLPPVLAGNGVRLREVEPSDAGALLALLGADQLARVIALPSSTADLAASIEAARLDRSQGRGVCFVALADAHRLAGVFRVRELEPQFAAAEWNFVLSAEQWGTGLFFRAAPLVVSFAFDVLQAQRLEARAALHNGRGNGALRKIGAVQECVLRQSLLQRCGYVDEALWTILAEDWRARIGNRGPMH